MLIFQQRLDFCIICYESRKLFSFIISNLKMKTKQSVTFFSSAEANIFLTFNAKSIFRFTDLVNLEKIRCFEHFFSAEISIFITFNAIIFSTLLVQWIYQPFSFFKCIFKNSYVFIQCAWKRYFPSEIIMVIFNQ